MLLLPRVVLKVPGTGSPQRPEVSHMHVCLKGIDDSSRVLLVPICSVRPKSDRTCVFNPGDYPPIKIESCIHYSRAQLWKSGPLIARIKRKEVDVLEILPEHLYTRVCAGIRTSPLCPRWVKPYYGNP